MKSFRRVLGDGYSYGQFANQNERDATCLFAMVISLSTKLDEFSPDDFDYIIIDEAHHCISDSYQRVLQHFPEAKIRSWNDGDAVENRWL